MWLWTRIDREAGCACCRPRQNSVVLCVFEKDAALGTLKDAREGDNVYCRAPVSVSQFVVKSVRAGV